MSDLWQILRSTSLTDVEFAIMQADLIDFPISPFGMTVGG
jgi:hypothetical protein